MTKLIKIFSIPVALILGGHLLLAGLFHTHDFDGCHVPVAHFYQQMETKNAEHHHQTGHHDGCHQQLCLCDGQLFFERPDDKSNTNNNGLISDIESYNDIIITTDQQIRCTDIDVTVTFSDQQGKTSAPDRAPPHSN